MGGGPDAKDKRGKERRGQIDRQQPVKTAETSRGPRAPREPALGRGPAHLWSSDPGLQLCEGTTPVVAATQALLVQQPQDASAETRLYSPPPALGPRAEGAGPCSAPPTLGPPVAPLPHLCTVSSRRTERGQAPRTHAASSTGPAADPAYGHQALRGQLRPHTARSGNRPGTGSPSTTCQAGPEPRAPPWLPQPHRAPGPSCTHLPGAPSSGRALRRKLSACSLRLSPEGVSAAAGPGPGVAPGVWKNRSRACWVLEDDGVQAGVLAGTGDAGLELSFVWGAVTRGVAQPCGVAGQGSGAHEVPVGGGLPAGDGHIVRELLVT